MRNVPTSTDSQNSESPRAPGWGALRLGQRGTVLVVGFWVLIGATLVARVAMYDQIAVGHVKQQFARLAAFVSQALGIG